MAKNGKMVILRGNADLSGKSYPDENGKMIKWPVGALHVQAAKDYAKQRDYEPVVFDIAGHPQSQHSPQSKATLELLRKDADVHALYGFSGGGDNVRHILKALSDNEPALLGQIRLVVVIGSPNKYGNDKLYKPALYGKQAGWELVFRCNPTRALMPNGLDKKLSTHMFGPDVLLAGWPEASSNCP
jgi:hypothetical protein